MSAVRTPIEAFRKRLNDLLEERFEGKYTVLAKRAAIPVSSMQHYMHFSKHMPGSEHLQRIAEALGCTTDFLITGAQTVRPVDLLTKPISVARAEGQEIERQLSVPVFRCTCPKDCAFSEDVPQVSKARSRVVIPTDMVGKHNFHRLMGVMLDGHLKRSAWGEEGRIVIDWDDRTPDWNRNVFFYDGTKHMVGRVKETDAGLLAADWNGQSPVVLPKTAKLLGHVVAIVAATP